MAKVIITFSDNDDGSVSVTTDFKPDLRQDQPMTNAQSDGLACLEFFGDSERFFGGLAKEQANG